jgi:hypothetical protein
MKKYIIGNLMYVAWTLLNVSHDSIFKYYNHLHLWFIFLIRYTLIFLITFFFKTTRKLVISSEDKKHIVILNFFKAIVTILGMIFVYKQIEISSLFSLNLIFFSIPLLDLIISKIFTKNKTDLKTLIVENLGVIINNIIILIYFIKEVYCYGISKIIYGFLGALMFSISNILILKTQKIWKNNIKYIPYDIFWFSLYMIIFSFFLIFVYNLDLTILLTNFHIGDMYFIIYMILGVLIQFLLYYLFFKNDFTPSNILVSIDLIVALIFGFFCNNEKINLMEIIVLFMIIIVPFCKKKFFVIKN